MSLTSNSPAYNGLIFHPNLNTIWYTSDHCIQSYPNYGFIKVLPQSMPSISLKYFSVTTSSFDLLTSMVNYLHSRYKLDGIRFQLYVFKGVHNIRGTSQYEYYYYIYLTSSVPLTLSCYDLMTNSNPSGIDMGGYLLLMSGFMPGFEYMDKSNNPTLLFPNYTNPAWTGANSFVSYAPNDITDVVKIFGTIVNNAVNGTDPFFTYGTDCAFFDSIDVDITDSNSNTVPLPDCATVMDEIINQGKPLNYFCDKYPDMMEEYYDNVMALILYNSRNQCPFYPAE